MKWGMHADMTSRCLYQVRLPEADSTVHAISAAYLAFLHRLIFFQRRSLHSTSRSLARSPYDVLGVGKDASSSEIKKNYYQVSSAL